MSRICILGIGSPAEGDRIGWELAEALRRFDWCGCFPQHEITIDVADRPGSRLLDLFAGADLAVVIDAMQSGAPPGTVCRIEPDQLQTAQGLHSTHGFGVAGALALGAALGRLPPRLVVYGIESSVTQAGAASEQPAPSDVCARLQESIAADIQGGG